MKANKTQQSKAARISSRIVNAIFALAAGDPLFFPIIFCATIGLGLLLKNGNLRTYIFAGI